MVSLTPIPTYAPASTSAASDPVGRVPSLRLSLLGDLRRRLALAALALATLSLPTHALSFLKSPVFTASTNAPLAGSLELSTDVDSRVGVTIDDGVAVQTRFFGAYATNHSIPLFGFKASRTNAITVTVYDRNRNAVSASQPLEFVTDPLPSSFPTMTLLSSVPSAMEPGYSLFIWETVEGSTTVAYSTIIDSAGDVVWYAPANGYDIRQLPNGNLFATLGSSFVETDLLGTTVHTWHPPALPLDPHDGVPTDHGTILYLADSLQTVTNFPTDPYDLNSAQTTADIVSQKVIEMSADTESLENAWSPVDLLDPRRISYLFTSLTDGLPSAGWDTEHANAVIEDPRDNSIIVSMRNQNAVFKFSRATGELKWILGPHENWGPKWQPFLLKPVGAVFNWQYGQHAPVLTPRGTLMLYDNGNFRASPPNAVSTDPNNFSRAVEYRINEQTMEVSQEWEYGSATLGEWLFTGYMGNAEPQPKTGNVLIDFSAVSYSDGAYSIPSSPGAVMAHFKEVTHDPVPQVVFDLTLNKYDKANVQYINCTVYRVHRIPDLYAHPAIPVTDLSTKLVDGVARLEFSGDPARTYSVQASADLLTWQSLGPAANDSTYTASFEFQDPQPEESTVRYYRVITE